MENEIENEYFFKQLEEACSELVYMSEMDAPFEPFAGRRTNELSKESFLESIDADASLPVEEISFQNFFDRFTAKRDWHMERDKKRISRYTKLRELLEQNLQDLRVFRIGKIRIDLYAVGVDENGRVLGVKTHAVET